MVVLSWLHLSKMVSETNVLSLNCGKRDNTIQKPGCLMYANHVSLADHLCPQIHFSPILLIRQRCPGKPCLSHQEEHSRQREHQHISSCVSGESSDNSNNERRIKQGECFASTGRWLLSAAAGYPSTSDPSDEWHFGGLCPPVSAWLRSPESRPNLPITRSPW